MKQHSSLSNASRDTAQNISSSVHLNICLPRTTQNYDVHIIAMLLQFSYTIYNNHLKARIQLFGTNRFHPCELYHLRRQREGILHKHCRRFCEPSLHTNFLSLRRPLGRFHCICSFDFTRTLWIYFIAFLL